MADLATGIQPPLSFRYDEALALYLGRKFLEPLAGTLFWDAAQRAFQKIRPSLGKPALDYLARLTDVFHPTTVGASDYTSKAELIDTLMVAIEDCKAVHILYQSQRATEPAFRDVYPYGISYHRGSLYLVAHAPEYEEIRHYKVDRIEAVEISPFPFRRPRNFDLATHMASSFGVYQGKDDVMVRIRLIPDTARYVLESKWHPSQRLTRGRDGSVLAEFRLCGTEEIRSWVLSFGTKAVVLEPESLRREIQAELRLARSLRSPDGSHPPTEPEDSVSIPLNPRQEPPNGNSIDRSDPRAGAEPGQLLSPALLPGIRGKRDADERDRRGRAFPAPAGQ